MRKVVLGLSGGVDSAVAARLLLREGYDVRPLFLKIGSPAAESDARRTSSHLGLELQTEDISDALEEHVCKPFCTSYLKGETPNPCILCNPAVKFKALCDYADKIGASYIATGHYARAENGKILKGMPANDQSYLLCRVLRSQAERLILPLGNYEKKQVREMAEAYEIPVAKKPDSMEICFIPDKDYIGWLSRRTEIPGEGDVLFHGERIASHSGICSYTVGQRLPGLYHERKLYVDRILPEENIIVAALWEELFKTEITARDMNWLIDLPEKPFHANVRVRHTKWENPTALVSLCGNGVRITADEPFRAPAAGQSAALYDGDRLLGGGIISCEL